MKMIEAEYSKHWTQRAKERERMEKLFPLFTFHWVDDEKGGGCYAETGRGSKQFLNGNHRELEERLTTQHRLESIGRKLAEQYPALQFLALENTETLRIDVWVRPKNEGVCGTGITQDLDITRADFHSVIASMNAEAEKSLQDGFFFCSGHKRAESQSEYSYYYFTGKYCKEYAAAHPGHRTAASKETYE